MLFLQERIHKVLRAKPILKNRMINSMKGELLFLLFESLLSIFIN